jgi:uncharacterized membrane protein (Fun14 family)
LKLGKIELTISLRPESSWKKPNATYTRELTRSGRDWIVVMTKKPQSPDPAKPDAEDEAKSRTGPEIIGQLSRTLASDKNQKIVEDARHLLEDHEEKISSKAPPPTEEKKDDVKEEVEEAATTLTSAVDQMVPSLLLSLGMLDAAIKWMKFVAVLIGVAIIGVGVLIENGIRTANSNKRAADEVSAAKFELVRIKGELEEIKKSIIDVRKADAKREIAAAAETKLVAGDKPGEVALVTPDISEEEIKIAQKKAEEAVEKGEKPPAPPTAKGTKIPVKLGEKKERPPWEQAPPPPPPPPPDAGP